MRTQHDPEHGRGEERTSDVQAPSHSLRGGDDARSARSTSGITTPITDPLQQVPSRRPFVKTFSLRGHARYAYTPKETRTSVGHTTFRTLDGTRYERNAITGVIRRLS